jgi:hypothetical protein
MVNTKRKGETQYETPKPSKTPKPLLLKKKQKPQRLAGADAWLPSSPGWCYQPGLEVLLPGRPQRPRGAPLVPVGVTNRD